MKQTMCDKCGCIAKKHFRIEVRESEDSDVIGPGLKYPQEFRHERLCDVNELRPTLELCQRCWGDVSQDIEKVREGWADASDRNK